MGKHAMNGLTKATAAEYAQQGIRCNAICPGPIETELMKDAGAQVAQAAGITYETNFPEDGIYGGFYGQGVIKDSPNQACSKLWMEHIFSDQGALGYLEGGAVPARIEALTEAGLVTEDMKTNLPPDELLSQVEFLTPNQVAAAKEVLAANWGPMVADAG
jgi:ABC-type Fe3+ transport system substrate-binding protein